MNSRLNYEAIDEYSVAYTQAVLDQRLTGKDQLTGNQILELCNVRQVNLFIIKLLFEQWQTEIGKFKSPYFDYEAHEVVNALKSFQNTLSRHISIDRKHLEPIMIKAVGDTLLLVLSPYHFFYNELNSSESVDVVKLKASKKFIKINTAIYHTLIEKIEKVSNTSVSNKTAVDLLDHVLEETNVVPEDANEYVVKLNESVPLNIESIYKEENSTEIQSESQSNEPISSPQQIIESVQQYEQEVDGLSEEELPKKGEDLAVSNQEEEINIVGEQVEELENPDNVVTINEAFQREEKSLADLHQVQKISSIENSVTLNQRFMFVNTLFDGDIDLFNKTIVKLDQMENFEDADEYLASHFGTWDNQEDEVKEFMDIVVRRFAES